MKSRYAATGITVAVALCGFFATALDSSCTSSEVQGDEAGPCYPNGSCDSGLTCVSNLCAHGDAGSEGASSSGGISRSGGSSSSGAGGGEGGVSVADCGAHGTLGSCGANDSSPGGDASSEASSGSSGDSGSSADGSTGGCATMTNQLTVKFNPAYSAYEPNHTYAVPIAVNAMNATLTASDPTAVGIQLSADLSRNGFTGWILTMLKAPTGPVTLTAQVGNDCTATQLFVTSVTSDDWQIGNQRYSNGASLHLLNPDGSIFETADGGPACTSCHGPTAPSGFLYDVNWTPEQAGGYSDDDLIGIVVHGVVPEGGYFDPNIISMMNFHTMHQWTDIAPDQYKGIVAYLRSLAPMAQQGPINLGGFGPGGPGAGGGG
jgi:hypothetical protein